MDANSSDILPSVLSAAKTLFGVDQAQADSQQQYGLFGTPTPTPSILVSKPPSTNPGQSASALEPASITSAGGSAGGLKYTVDQWTYPLAVSGSQDLQHYVVFFINVRGKSKFINSYGPKTAITKPGLSNAGLVQAGTAITIGGLSAAGVLAAIGGASAVTKAIGVTAAAATTADLSQAANAATGFFQPDQSFRISKAIMLAVNEKPSVTYGMQYEGKDLGTLVGFASGASSIQDLLSNSATNKDVLRVAAMSAAKLPGGIASAFGFDLDTADAIQLGTATTPNPFREQIFRNVDTREFVFNYKFLPRSQEEAAHVQNIIREFKFHMHPELSGSKIFYVYPSTFDIAYYYKGQRNNSVHRISTCVLEKLSVDYGSDSGFHSFADGSATEIDIRLQFREIEVLTKNRIQQGF